MYTARLTVSDGVNSTVSTAREHHGWKCTDSDHSVADRRQRSSWPVT